MAKRRDPWPSGKDAAYKRYRAALREARKLRGFRFTDDALWRREGEFFVKATTMTLNDRLGASIAPRVKPLASDDILWDVLGFQGNKGARASLRATGAFVGPSATIGVNEGCIAQRIRIGGEGDIEGLAEAVVEFVDDVSSAFLDSIGRDVGRYFELSAELNDVPHDKAHGAYHEGLYRCIALIYLGDYDAAMELAERQIATGDDIFKFGVGPKGDATLVKEYCERRLAAGAKGAGAPFPGILVPRGGRIDVIRPDRGETTRAGVPGPAPGPAIDGISYDAGERAAVMLLADDLGWEDEAAHLSHLQGRLDACAALARGRRYEGLPPGAEVERAVVRLEFSGPITERCWQLVRAAGARLEAELGIVVSVSTGEA